MHRSIRLSPYILCNELESTSNALKVVENLAEVIQTIEGSNTNQDAEGLKLVESGPVKHLVNKSLNKVTQPKWKRLARATANINAINNAITTPHKRQSYDEVEDHEQKKKKRIEFSMRYWSLKIVWRRLAMTNLAVHYESYKLELSRVGGLLDSS